MKAITLSVALALGGCQMTPQQAEALSQSLMQAGQYQAQQPSYRPVAMYTGERVSGFNKMCFYNRVGSMESYNVPATGMCPLQVP